jgi:phosphoglycolate phosphatase-like HAD superfamily hydrolase
MTDKKRHSTVIFFDWDGTLADSMDLNYAGIEGALRRMGLPPVSRETMAACNGPAYDASIRIVGIPPERGQEFLDLRTLCEHEALAATQKLFPGIPAMLDALGEQATLAIISYGQPEYLEESLALTGIGDRFAQVQGWMAGHTKGELLARLVQALQPEKAALVGDCTGDFEAARFCGIPALAVRYGYGREADWALADEAVDTVEEIPAAALRLAEGYPKA